MKKVVLKLDLHDDRAKQKAMKAVSTLPGIDSVSMDMKEKKLTIIGSVDPVQVVNKLRKYWHTDLVTVGPKEEPKKEEPKKEEGKKEEPKKEEGGGGEKKEEPKKDEGKKEEPKKEEGKKDELKKEDEKKPDPVLELGAYRPYYPQMTTHYYAHSMEENPNACVIC